MVGSGRVKPRIKRYPYLNHVLWQCSCGEFIRLGYTPDQAYFMWLEEKEFWKNYLNGIS